MSMSYREITNKIRQSKARILRLQEEIVFEKNLQTDLIRALQSQVTQETGVEVTLFKNARPTNSTYDREAVISRIIQLRNVNTSFSIIAQILNKDGLKSLHGKEFNSSGVTQLYRAAVTKAPIGKSLGAVQIEELESYPVAHAAAG